MKRTLAGLLFLLAAVLLTNAQAKFSVYANDRFFFTVEYPSELQMQPPPENNDGRTFLSADGTVELRAWGQFNVLDYELEDKYHEDASFSGASITYRALLKNGFVLSGMIGDTIFYQKTLRHKFPDADVFYTFTIKYPKTERKKYDAVVKRIAASFKFDPKADV